MVQSIDELSREVETAQSQIATIFEKSAISDRTHKLTTSTAITDLRTSVDAAITVIKLERSNRYFDVPQVINPIFTERSDLLAKLKGFFFEVPATVPDHQQRRFVIYGIGGSGKTQLCTIFAYKNRDRYWGVFWIDLSSPERASQTCVQIAKTGGAEPTVNASMHWLSGLRRQYLLILDNADDPSLSLTDYLPQGDRGHVLVTTRNPAYKKYGGIGCRHLELEALNVDDASSLHLKAAAQRIQVNRLLEYGSFHDIYRTTPRHLGKSHELYRRRRPYPPPAFIEDEIVSLAKESRAFPIPSYDPPLRGIIDQDPIILEADVSDRLPA
ncbi:P-loop containing nucleoside triphosphate hydrolase protein [Tricladium varicosporioides]|nr:P-loop containing nucleoside triphosphate hydrolase protein [Hymenoscyphus varicosporioides]